MLKKQFILLFYIVTLIPAFAQDSPKHLPFKNLNIGGGYSHYVSDYNGYNLMAELSLDLNKHLCLALGGRYIDTRGVPDHTGVEGWIKSPGLYSNLCFFIINKPKHRLKVGGGIVYQSYEKSYSSLNNGEPEIHLVNANTINGNLIVDYVYNFHHKYLIGGRFGSYPIAGNGGFNLTAYVGFKF